MKHLNPRKLIKQWAEKEYGNLLKILTTSDIRVPVPLLLKKNILLMTFIGDLEPSQNSAGESVHLGDGRAFLPAPRLNQIISTLTLKRRFYYYFECILMMRKLYQRCGLVHADLSEYNILVHNHHLYFIDLSQGCEINSSNALEFLKRDCYQITKFFKNATNFETSSSNSSNNDKPVDNSTPERSMESMRFILPLIELFKFITDKTISDEMVVDYLIALKESLVKKAETQTEEDRTEEQKREAVFMNTRVATKMSEIEDLFQNDSQLEETSESNYLFHQSVVGQRPDMSGPASDIPELLEGKYVHEDDDDDDDDSSESDEDEDSEDSDDQ